MHKAINKILHKYLKYDLTAVVRNIFHVTHIMFILLIDYFVFGKTCYVLFKSPNDIHICSKSTKFRD